MTRFYLGFLFLLILPLAGGLLLARELGRAVSQPVHPVLAGFSENCAGLPQPCWHGIIPGTTTAHDASGLMAFAGEPDIARSIFSRDYTLIYRFPDTEPFCQVSLSMIQEVVNRVEIRLCRQPDVRAGDMAVFLDSTEKRVSLPPNEQIYGGVAINVDGWPTPYSRVAYIGLLSPDIYVQPYPWLGFIPQDRYCQLVPDYPRCGTA